MADVGFETFEVGGIEIPVFSVIDFNQSYEVIGGSSLLRMLDGAAVKQNQWSKIRTTISGSGSIPPGLEGLDYTTSKTLKCAGKKSISSLSNVIVLPAARRSDTPHLPRGFAMVDRLLVATSISISTNTATLGVVSGADFYTVHYWPQITVFVQPPRESHDVNGAVINWSLEAEET